MKSTTPKVMPILLMSWVENTDGNQSSDTGVYGLYANNTLAHKALKMGAADLTKLIKEDCDALDIEYNEKNLTVNEFIAATHRHDMAGNHVDVNYVDKEAAVYLSYALSYSLIGVITEL